MDWKTLTADIVGSLAWPTAVVVIAFIFRKEAGKLISRVASLKYGDAEIKFNEIVATLQEQERPEAAADLEPAQGEKLGFLLRLADISPKHAVLEAWSTVEKSAQRALDRAGKKKALGINYAERTFCPEILTAKDALKYQKLEMARNMVAHKDGFDFDLNTPQTYVRLALELIRKLDAYQP